LNALIALFAGRTDNTLVQLVRYTFVGGLAFAVDFGALFVLTRFVGLHYLVSAAIAFGLGLATNYVISVVWVFDQRVMQNRWAEFLVFAGLGVVGLGLNELGMYALTDLVGLHYLGSKVVSTVLTYGWNFASRKLLLFSRPAVRQPEPALAVEAR
jgi:putative flippase GtrA